MKVLIRCPGCKNIIEDWEIEVKEGQSKGYFTEYGFFQIKDFDEKVNLYCPIEECSFSLKDKTFVELENWFEEMIETKEGGKTVWERTE